MKRNKLFSIPYVIWMALFVVAPIILVVLYAFTAADGGFTFANFTRMGNYIGVFVRSFWLALVATAICLVIGYPIAYLISKESKRFQRISLLNRFFSAIGLIDLVNGILGTNMTYFNMINTPGAVVLGMVYNFLPFMILPIHSVIQKIDRNLIEAAQDLGSNNYHVFTKVIFPLSLPGVLSGITMVFVPAVSTFAISKLLGGSKDLLLGDLIEIQFLGSAYNPHLGSAISLVMMLIVVICMVVMNRFGEGEETAVML